MALDPQRLGFVKVGDILPDVLPRLPKKPSKSQLRVIEAGASLDAKEILYQHTVFCQVSLPYRDPGRARTWTRKNGNVSLHVAAGVAMSPVPDQGLIDVGLPFGAKPRLILGDMNTQAILTQSPEIDLEKSLSRYVKRLGIHQCGRDIKTVKEALTRVCAASFTIGLQHEGGAKTYGSRVVSEFDIWFPKDERQRVLWPSAATLSLDYFKILLTHGVPLDEAAYFSLSHNAMAMDIYAWLAQRLHRVHPQAPTLVTWPHLHLQFGWHFKRLRKFREVFKVSLEQALVAYRTARVEVDGRGLTLKISPPPVVKTQILVASKS